MSLILSLIYVIISLAPPSRHGLSSCTRWPQQCAWILPSRCRRGRRWSGDLEDAAVGTAWISQWMSIRAAVLYVDDFIQVLLVTIVFPLTFYFLFNTLNAFQIGLLNG